MLASNPNFANDGSLDDNQQWRDKDQKRSLPVQQRLRPIVMMKKAAMNWCAVWKMFFPGTAADKDHVTTVPMAARSN